MNKEELIDMAREAGFFINDKLTVTSPFIEDICILPMLKEFAKLVAEKERDLELVKQQQRRQKMIYKTIEEWIEHNPNHIGALPIEVCHQIWGTKGKGTSMTNEERKVMEQALEFIERINKDGWILADFEPQMYETITAIKEVLAQEQEQDQEPVADNTYGYAKSLAEAIFKQHFSSDDHYASGRIVWGVNDTVIGILTQIDNMVADMVRKPLAQPEQEPVAWRVWNPDGEKQYAYSENGDGEPLYTNPPKREWAGLTRMDLITCGVLPFGMSYELCQAIEAKLKQKNGYAEEKNT